MFLKITTKTPSISVHFPNNLKVDIKVEPTSTYVIFKASKAWRYNVKIFDVLKIIGILLP